MREDLRENVKNEENMREEREDEKGKRDMMGERLNF